MMTPFFIATKDLESKWFNVYFMVYVTRDNWSDEPDDYISTYASKGINKEHKDHILTVQSDQWFDFSEWNIVLTLAPNKE